MWRLMNGFCQPWSVIELTLVLPGVVRVLSAADTARSRMLFGGCLWVCWVWRQVSMDEICKASFIPVYQPRCCRTTRSICTYFLPKVARQNCNLMIFTSLRCY